MINRDSPQLARSEVAKRHINEETLEFHTFRRWTRENFRQSFPDKAPNSNIQTPKKFQPSSKTPQTDRRLKL
jgi:hypothetical protein